MSEMQMVQEILEWYLSAGVDETCGEFAFEQKSLNQEIPKVGISTLAPKAPFVRQATTELAQATINACKNAKDICANIQSLEELKTAVENFDGCALKLTASHTVFGDGNPNAKVVIIGEAPGADEDRIGLPFVGKSGQLLDKMLASAKLDRSTCYICNILPWRPPGNRTPLDSEIAVCLPFLKKQIELINPDYIVVLGSSAANSALDINEPISKLRGKWLEYKNNDGTFIQALASFHPAYLLRTPAQKAKSWADFLRLYKKMQKIVE